MKLIYSPQASKKLKKIHARDLQKVYPKIQRLKENPLLGKPLHGDHEGQYSLRAWPLRIIYTFNPKTKIVEIITVDYRGSVYRK